MVDLAETFFDQTAYKKAGMEFDKDKLLTVGEMAIDHGLTFVDEDMRGMIVMLITSPPFSSDPLAVDLAFYVKEECRGGTLAYRLIQAMMREAEAQGIKLVSMMNLDSVTPDTAAKFYEKLGFTVAETTFTKNL